MKKIISLLVLCLLAAPALAEQDVEITTAPAETVKVFAGDSSFFDVEMKNSGPGDFFTFSLYPGQWANTEAGLNGQYIEQDGSAKFRVLLYPPSDTFPGLYGLTITVMRQSDGVKTEKKIAIGVEQLTTSGILSSVDLSCTECKEVISVTPTVKNTGTSPLKDAKLIFTFGNSAKEVSLDNMGSGETKSTATNFFVNYFDPGEYQVKVEFFSEGKFLDSKTAKFTVPVSRNPKIEKKRTIEWGFITTNQIFVKNEGNAKDNIEVVDAVDQSIFNTYSGPEPNSRENAWTWFVTLDPNESKEIQYSQIFWPAPTTLVLIVLVVAFSYFIVTELAIRKYLVHKGGDEFSVSLNVHNKGLHADGVEVRDFVPGFFSVIPNFETLKPIIRKVGRGTELLWRIGPVKKGEQRILHYKIRPNAPAGGSKLPPASVHGTRGGKVVVRSSNRVEVPHIQGKTEKLKVVVQE